MNDKKNIEILLDTVLERDMDLLIIEEFISNPEFAKILLSPFGLFSEYTIDSVIHSKRDSDLGESDIVFILNIDDRKHAIHIENKIDAQAMPDQHNRYEKRIAKDIAAGEYDTASWMLIAPEKYIASNTEAKKYKYHVTYEQLQDYFNSRCDKRAEYKRALINKAISDQKNSYQLQIDPAVDEFCNRMNQYQIQNYPGLPIGTIAWWPYRKTPLRGVSLVYKPNRGFADLTFQGMSTEALSSYAYDYISEKMMIVSTGKSSSIRIRVSDFSMRECFDKKIKEVDEALDALQELYALAGRLAKEHN